jgi:hypothetical protein
MSDSSHHKISIVNPARYIATEQQERLQLLGLAQLSSVQASTEPSRSLSFTSDAYRFPTDAKKLFDTLGVASWLRHLSDEVWGIEYPQGDEYWTETVHYSVLTSSEQMRTCASELSALLDWCERQPEAMAATLSEKRHPVGPECFLPQLKQRSDLSKPGTVHLQEDIDYVWLLFSALHTTAALLDRAATQGLWVTYESRRYEHSW